MPALGPSLAVLDNLHTGVVIHAADTSILYSNPRAAELLGLSKDQMLGKKAIDPGWHFVDADGQRIAADQYPVSRAITQRQPLAETVFGIIAPGRALPMWVLVRAYPEFEAQGDLRQVVVNFHDISALKQAQETLRTSEFKFRTMFETVAQGIVYQDRDGHITAANPAAQRILGLTLDQLQGRVSTDPSWRAVHEDGGAFPGEQHPAMLALRSGRPIHGVVMGIAAPGRSLVWISVDASPLFDDGAVSGVYAIFEDITERRDLEEQVRQRAFFDPLTRLPNRHLLNDRIAQALATCRRGGLFGALLVLDLDNFKQLNETLGHGMGDQLLVQVAQRLKDCMREADSVARLGGDEFLVLLKGLATQERDASAQAWDISLKVLQALNKPYDLGTQRHSCTASIGVVLFKDRENGVNDLLRMADVAMYQAKAAGGNTARFYDPAMQATAEARTQLEQDLRRGLAMREFELFYQVQVNLDRVPVGVEALVRWRHPVRGLLPPADFIALAEQTGVILELGQWVLETACSQLALWANVPGKGDWTLAVNVSASQFAHASFVANVFRALDQTGAPAQRLKLELTESMLAVDIEDIIFKMLAIKSRGVSFGLDDFGTGYSSLSYLKRLPLAQLKIDRSFVRDILSDPNDAAIVRAILVLGHTMGLEVIAEGVETAEQHEFLAQLGCDAFQGFLFGRPVPQTELDATLAPPATCH